MKKVLLFPWYLLQLLTQSKSHIANPLIGSRWLNRLGLHVFRLVFAHAISHWRWWLLSPWLSKEERRCFHRDGYLIVHEFLSPDDFQLLRQALYQLQGPVRECSQGNTDTRRVLLDETIFHQQSIIAHFIQQRRFQALLKYAANSANPPLCYMQSIKNGYRHHNPNQDPQKTLHSDTFQPSMKAWFFTEEVTEEKGPFNYVPGSNRLTWRRLCWEYRRSCTAKVHPDGYSEKGSFRIDESELMDIGLGPVKSFTVPANTLVIANTYGFHRRGSAIAGASRNEIWCYSRSNPFNPWPGFDASWLRRGIHSGMQKYWRVKDWQAKRRGKKSSWHLVPAEKLYE